MAAADGAGGLAIVTVDVAAVPPGAQLVEHAAEVVRAATRHEPSMNPRAAFEGRRA